MRGGPVQSRRRAAPCARPIPRRGRCESASSCRRGSRGENLDAGRGGRRRGRSRTSVARAQLQITRPRRRPPTGPDYRRLVKRGARLNAGRKADAIENFIAARMRHRRAPGASTIRRRRPRAGYDDGARMDDRIASRSSSSKPACGAVCTAPQPGARGSVLPDNCAATARTFRELFSAIIVTRLQAAEQGAAERIEQAPFARLSDIRGQTPASGVRKLDQLAGVVRVVWFLVHASHHSKKA